MLNTLTEFAECLCIPVLNYISTDFDLIIKISEVKVQIVLLAGFRSFLFDLYVYMPHLILDHYMNSPQVLVVHVWLSRKKESLHTILQIIIIIIIIINTLKVLSILR